MENKSTIHDKARATSIRFNDLLSRTISVDTCGIIRERFFKEKRLVVGEIYFLKSASSRAFASVTSSFVFEARLCILKR